MQDACQNATVEIKSGLDSYLKKYTRPKLIDDSCNVQQDAKELITKISIAYCENYLKPKSQGMQCNAVTKTCANTNSVWDDLSKQALQLQNERDKKGSVPEIQKLSTNGSGLFDNSNIGQFNQAVDAANKKLIGSSVGFTELRGAETTMTKDKDGREIYETKTSIQAENITVKETWSKPETLISTDGEKTSEFSKLEKVEITLADGTTISGASDAELLKQAEQLDSPAKEKFKEAIKDRNGQQALDSTAESDYKTKVDKSKSFSEIIETSSQSLMSNASNLCKTTTEPYIDQNCIDEIKEAIYNGSDENIEDINYETAGGDKKTIKGGESEGDYLLDKKGIKNHLKRYLKNYEQASKKSVETDQICSKTRNARLSEISGGLTLLSGMFINMSASKTCGAFALANGIGQMFCLQAAANCSIKRFACTFAAGASNKNLKKMTKRLESLKKNQTILSNGGTSLIDQIINQIEVESKNAVSPIISSCNSHDKSIQDLIVTAAGMANAMKQGKDCQNKLSSMSSTNNTGKIVSMEEMCAQPANASSTICKCRTDNTAKGCPGYIAGNANEGNINKDLNTKGTSNMAGLSYKPKNIPTSGVDLDKNLDDLSDEAKKALAAGGDQKQESGSMFGVAGAANAGGGASTSSAAAAGAGSEKGKLADEPKSIGSSFMNAIGSLVGKDRSGGKPSAAKDDKFASDKYKEQIKRQIASEQMRNEVSSASGISNWDKIRTRYNHNKDSFIGD